MPLTKTKLSNSNKKSKLFLFHICVYSASDENLLP